MKIENLSQELKEKVKQLLESAPADQKADAIMQSIEMIEEAAHEELINQVVAEAERASHDAEYQKQIGTITYTHNRSNETRQDKDCSHQNEKT